MNRPTRPSALVTGGSRGVGAQVARQLAARGHHVTFGFREKAARADQVVARIQADGGAAVAVPADLTVETDRARLVSTALEHAGRLDVVVLAASGGMEAGRPGGYAHALNSEAQVALVRAAVPMMSPGGRIVLVTSHQAHFSREVPVEEEYVEVAAAKRHGEDALRGLLPWLDRHDVRLVVASADVLEDSATTLLMERVRPGSTAERRREVGTLPRTADFATTIVRLVDAAVPSGHVELHGGASWFHARRRATACDGPRVVGATGSTWCAVSATDLLVDRLTERGVRPGSRVLVCDEPCPELALVIIALMRLDASVVLLDSGTPDAAFQDRARESATELVVGPHRPLGTSLPDVGWLGTCTSLGSALDARAAARCLRGCGRTGRAVDLSDDRAEAFTRWRRRRDALVMWTSGSSGTPTGVVKTGAAVLDNTRVTAAAMGYTPSDRLLPLLPMTHQYGMSLVLAWWLVGCELLVGNHRRPVQTLRQLHDRRPTVVDATPPVMAEILTVLRSEGVAAVGPEVRMWCVGGAPLPSRLAEGFCAATGRPLLDGYGSTELGNVALATLADSRDLGRPLPGVEVRVLTADGVEAPPGVTGEVVIRSRYVFDHYLVPGGRTPDEAGWLVTGDLGSVDASGRLRVVGRAHAVHRGGMTLYPASIERAAEVEGIPLVVVALPDERMGAHLTGVVQDPHGAPATRWKARLREFLAAHEVPDRILVVESMPLLSNGKMDRARLTERAQRARHDARRGAGTATDREPAEHRGAPEHVVAAGGTAP